MATQSSATTDWLSLPYADWKDTKETLHMWLQIIGKIKLACSPFLNQWWEVALYLTATGLTTGRIPYQNGVFEISCNFITHTLSITTSAGASKIVLLRPCTVAVFYAECMQALSALGIAITIYPVPAEVKNPIPFQEDTTHQAYDTDFVTRWFRIQLQICTVFDTFRTSFRGKSSPIQFFWGSFDLNGTRFSGKSATPPEQTGSIGKIMQYAENEENFAFGFWPGDERYPFPAIYTYIYPAPQGLNMIRLGSSVASFSAHLAECILPYEELRKTAAPKEDILSFLQTTYVESAKLAGWDTTALTNVPPETI